MPKPRGRGTAVYTKPPLSEADLVARWETRGLTVPDHERAQRYLRHIGYFRLSGYVRSFEDGSRDLVRPGTTFDDVLKLYIFDRRLRLLVLDAIERVEVALRAALTNHMAVQHGANWYENPSLFADPGAQSKLLSDIDKLMGYQLVQPKEKTSGRHTFVSALEYYLTHYGTPVRPPSWLAFEELTIGAIRTAYTGLGATSDQDAIAKTLGVNKDVLLSWLACFQRVRNICAHHGRLWNRGIGVYPMIPKSWAIKWLVDPSWQMGGNGNRRQRLYPVLVALQTILYTVSPHSSWASRLHALLADQPKFVLQGMGFPEDWAKDPFWAERINGDKDEIADL